MTIRLSDVSSPRGAPMGRRGHHAHGMDDLEFELERVPLVDGAYDCGGAYWGAPDNLWAARAELDGEELAFFFVRGDDEMACEQVLHQYPEATFKPQTGSVIEQTIRFLQAYRKTLNHMDEESQDEVEEVDTEIAELEEQLTAIRHKQETNP